MRDGVEIKAEAQGISKTAPRIPVVSRLGRLEFRVPRPVKDMPRLINDQVQTGRNIWHGLSGMRWRMSSPEMEEAGDTVCVPCWQ